MKKEEIHLSDWQRILIGNNPWEFTIEVFFRTLIIFLILVITLRLLGKRMSAQMSIFELAVMVALGAIVSVPMQLAERGLLLGVVVLVCVIVLQRTLTWLTFKNKKIEDLTQGKVSLLVKDGCLQVDELKRATTSREQLFAQLRSQGIQQLGQVERVYLEACGLFSLFKSPEPKLGLSILPEQDQKLICHQQQHNEYYACLSCGNTVQKTSIPSTDCENCSECNWTPATDGSYPYSREDVSKYVNQ